MEFSNYIGTSDGDVIDRYIFDVTERIVMDQAIVVFLILRRNR